MKKLSILLLAVFMLFIGASRSTAAAEPYPDLFTPVNLESSQSFPEHPLVIRSSIVQLNFQHLESSSNSINLNLFLETSYPAVLVEQNPVSENSRNWVGEISGMPFSEVVIISSPESVSGYIRLPGEFYRLKHLPGIGTAIIQLPPDDVPGMDSTSLDLHPIPPSPEFAVNQPIFEDSSSRIDVMFVYTTNAKNAEGGTANMVSMIEGIIVETNIGFNNSGVNTQMQLVHSMEVSYDDSWIDHQDDWFPMLDKLTSKTDGVIDNIHSVRDQYGADLVVLLISDTSLGGIAWVMQSNSSYYESYGFSVVAQAFALGYYVTGHEMGHNMGSAHDRANASVTGVYSYSYGYQINDTFRTIMSYPCPAGHYCPRINHWSNPDISYGGNPTGIVYTANNSADNARSLNNTISTVANFRQSVNSPPDVPIPTSPTGTIIDQTPTFIWSVEDGAEDYNLYVEHISSGVQINSWLTSGDVCGISTCQSTPSNDLAAGNYSWKVQARNTNGESGWSGILEFTILLAPEAATLVSPSGIINSSAPAYQWTEGFQAENYRLYITGAGGVLYNQWLSAGDVCIGPDCSYTPNLPLENGVYHWMVQTSNGAGAGPWTDPTEFTVSIAPGQVTVSSPAGEITAVRPAYIFSSDPAALEYRLLVSHAAFGTVVNEWHAAVDVCSGDTCAITADSHLSTGNHTFWIQTRNPYHSGPFSNPSNFKLIHYSPPVDPIQPLAPIEDAISGPQPALSWQAVDLASWYKVFISDNVSGKVYNAYHRASEVCSADTCTLDLSSVGLTLAGGKNFWWVMPVNTGGNGDWSARQDFIVVP